MPTEKLTDLLLRNLSKRLSAKTPMEEVWDEKVTGLGVRASQSGVKYMLRYRLHGRRRRFGLGSYPELSLAKARKKAKDCLGQVATGEDPAQKRQQLKKAKTFQELGQLYLEKHARVKKRVRSHTEDTRILEKYLYPEWGNARIHQIKRPDIIDLLEGIAYREVRPAPVMANRIRALISKVFNFALSRDLIPFNPCQGVARLVKEKGKKTVLSDSQIQYLWKMLAERGEPTASLFKIILATAQRPGEVKQMKWADLDQDIWHIPEEIAKNGREHFVPLPLQAKTILDSLSKTTGKSEWVFASPQGGHIEHLHSMTKRLNKAIEADQNIGTFHWSPHDLRRSAITGMAALGTHRDVLAKILNHKSSDNTVTAVYDRYDRMPEMKKALQKWADHLEKVVTGKKRAAKVLPFR